MIRFLLVMICLIILGIISVFAYPICRLVKKSDPKKGDLMAFHFVQFWLKAVAWLCGCKVTYKGLEYLPEDGDPVVFVANHRSYFDIILTYPMFKGRTGALAKKELAHYPIIGLWLRTIYGIFLDRKDIRAGLKSISEGIGYIKNGISILTFPEGTRCHNEGELLMFHKGTFRLATKPKVRIIPIAINNTGAIFDDHKPFARSCHSIIEFCEPIETKNLTKEEEENLPQTISALILEKITKNAAEV